jgi:hypothetical protein
LQFLLQNALSDNCFAFEPRVLGLLSQVHANNLYPHIYYIAFNSAVQYMLADDLVAVIFFVVFIQICPAASGLSDF